MKTTKFTMMTALAGCLTLGAFEGGYDYGDLLKNGGTFYNNSDNPYIQKARVYGRVQFQAATVIDESDNSENYTELRRTRLGAEIKFLNHFKFKGNANLENGGANEVDFGGFTGWDEAGITADLAGLFNLSYFDALKLTVGKQKISIGADVHTSSKKILTVERSAVTSRLRPDNSTGVLLGAEQGGMTYALGVFSNADADEFNGWSDSNGSFIYASTGFELGSGILTLDATYSLDDQDDLSGSATGTQWGASAAYATSYGETNVVYNVFLGDNGDLGNEDRSGLFYGASVLASREIATNLEAVGRAYYWMSEEDEGVRVNSRYSRSSAGGATSALGNSGRGDQHGSLYGGLNYYFSGHNSKVMTGVEWESLNTPEGADSATTLWAAYRMYF